MVITTRPRFIIQAPSGTDLSAIKPKLPRKSTLVPLKHQMAFGGRTYRYFVPNDGFDYFLFKRNISPGIRAGTLQERLENEEWVVRDVLDFGEKVISEKPDKRLTKEFQEKYKKISEFVDRDALNFGENEISQKKDQKVVRDLFDFGEEEEILHKKLKHELQEKDKEIAVLNKRIKVCSRENETLQKMLLKSIEKQVRKVREEQLGKFEKEFGNKGQAQDTYKKLYCLKKNTLNLF